jgi:hypothetical protein
MLLEDDSKTVPCYRVRQYVFKFVPPDLPYVAYNIGSTNDVECINLRKFMLTDMDLKAIPGQLNFSDTLQFNTRIKISCKVEYRGSRIPEAQTMQKLIEHIQGRPQLNRVAQYVDVGPVINENNNNMDDEQSSQIINTSINISQ